MRKLSLVLLLLVLVIAGSIPAAADADLEPSWGADGVAELALPAETSVRGAALLADGRVVIVGEELGGSPWGAIVSNDGATLTPLSSSGETYGVFNSVVIANDRIYAIGGRTDLGFEGIVAVFDTDGLFLDLHTLPFDLFEFDYASSAVADSAGRLFVAGRSSGSPANTGTWVLRLLPSGEADPAFPTLFLDPPDSDSTSATAYVGATAGQPVAVVVGDRDTVPRSSIGFHRITETGAVFMSDFSSAGVGWLADIDSSSGHAVFGSFLLDFPETPPADASYLIHSIGVTGAVDQTSAGTWVAADLEIQVGRTRTGELLGGGGADGDVFVELVQTATPFATRTAASIADIITSPIDGGVYVVMQDIVSGDLVIAKYLGDDSGRFIDDDSSVHEANIEILAEPGITRGCNPPVTDRYCPNDAVTRGQMAALLTRALALPASPTDYFVDDDGSVFEDDINAIAMAGITLGCNPPTNDRFCPNGAVTRGQMAALFARALALPASPTDYFVDDDGSVFEDDINAIAMAGITLGCNPPTNDRYCPDADVTRGQMASFIVRATAP